MPKAPRPLSTGAADAAAVRAGGQPDALRLASRDKAADAYNRAAAALRRLRKEQSDITFASVARAAGVSQRYLHAHPELGPQIRKLRRSLTSQPVPEPRGTEPGVVAVLRAKIQAQQKQIADLQDDNQRLRHDLAVAYGEIVKRPQS